MEILYTVQLLNACRGPGRPMQPPRTATMSNRKGGSRDDDEGKVASNKASTTTIKSKKGSGAATRCQKNDGFCSNAHKHRGKCNNNLKGIRSSSSDDDEGKVASKKASTTIKSKKDRRCQKNDGVCSNAHKHRGKCNNKHKERGRGRPINNPATSAAPPPKKRGRGPDPDAQPPPPKRPRVRTGAGKTKGKRQGAGVNGEHDDRDTNRAVFNRSGHQQQQDFHKSRTSDGVTHWVLNKSLRLVSNENSRIDWAMKSKIASLFDDALGGAGKGPEAEFGRRLKQLLHGVSKEDKDEDILGIGQDIVAAYDGIFG